jgi:hypothetical protein
LLSTRGTNGAGGVGVLVSAEPQSPAGLMVKVADLLWRRRQSRDLARRAEWAEQARRTPPLSVIGDLPAGEGDD